MITNNDRVFHIYVYIPTGSIHETKKTAGISHLLEHMLFHNKGNGDIPKALTAIGGSYNAATSKDTTLYYIETRAENFRDAIDIIHHITRFSNFDADDVLREKRVVVEELGQSLGKDDNITTLTGQTVFHDKNVYMKSVIGRKTTLESITVKDLKKYVRERYVDFMVLINCDFRFAKSAEAYTRKKFGVVKSASFRVEEPEMLAKSQLLEPKLIFLYQPAMQCVTCMTFGIPRITNARDYILLKFVQYCLTSSGLHSILNIHMRVQRGLVYTVTSYLEVYRYMSLYYIQFSSTNKRTDYMVNLVLEMIQRLKTKGFTSDQLEYYKRSYLSSLYVKFKNQSDRSEYFGFQSFYGIPHDEATMHRVVKKATNDDIKRLCTQYLDVTKLGVLSMGKYGSVDTMTKKPADVIETYRDVDRGRKS